MCTGAAARVLLEYIPEPWRTKYFLSHPVGEKIYYDAPDYAHAYAMRVDTFPTDGEFAGSDPELMFRQLIMEAGADIAILEPLAAGAGCPRPRRPRRSPPTSGSTGTGWTAGPTGTSAGAGRSRWPSRIRPVRRSR